MAHIRQIPPEEARGVLAREFAAARRRAGRIWNIVSIMSLNGPVLYESMRLYRMIMFGPSPLTRTHREMIAVVTSTENECDY